MAILCVKKLFKVLCDVMIKEYKTEFWGRDRYHREKIPLIT